MARHPLFVRTQPREWWMRVYAAGQRLANALWTNSDMRPLSPTEEALLSLAVEDDHIGAALDAFDEQDDRSLAALVRWSPPDGNNDFLRDVDPNDAATFPYDEVLAYLAGDMDLTVVMARQMDGWGGIPP